MFIIQLQTLKKLRQNVSFLVVAYSRVLRIFDLDYQTIFLFNINFHCFVISCIFFCPSFLNLLAMVTWPTRVDGGSLFLTFSFSSCFRDWIIHFDPLAARAIPWLIWGNWRGLHICLQLLAEHIPSRSCRTLFPISFLVRFAWIYSCTCTLASFSKKKKLIFPILMNCIRKLHP